MGQYVDFCPRSFVNMTRTSITLLLVLAVVFAGCASLTGNDDQTTTTTTIEKPTNTTASTTSTSTDAGDGTTDTSSDVTTTTTAQATTTQATTTTAESSWSEPKAPNTPLQNKMDSEDGGNWIQSVSVVNTKSGNGGYAAFDLKVEANTDMHHVDPAEHGTVNGEPFFLVYADGSLDNGSRFTRTEGTLIERMDVSRDENGEFTITIRPGGLEKAGVEDGEVKLMVLLMDEDKDWDDIYGVATVTVDYSSGE
ncbi:hypothetical protein SAMN05444342_2169 [Haladaptatus paucihalophilus DX253]|uniref:Uncharacterized protein n=2 Tax=Haladaptatus paucihalophilus DX253 TaxID=797209 RepID=A0A1M6VA84_HALPU|nr:hypothetical protein SAMN05444342_2169 [Haladaptatus paucihalophilus DX253]